MSRGEAQSVTLEKNTWLPTLNKIVCMTTVGIRAIERA